MRRASQNLSCKRLAITIITLPRDHGSSEAGHVRTGSGRRTARRYRQPSGRTGRTCGARADHGGGTACLGHPALGGVPEGEDRPGPADDRRLRVRRCRAGRAPAGIHPGRHPRRGTHCATVGDGERDLLAAVAFEQPCRPTDTLEKLREWLPAASARLAKELVAEIAEILQRQGLRVPLRREYDAGSLGGKYPDIRIAVPASLSVH